MIIGLEHVKVLLHCDSSYITYKIFVSFKEYRNREEKTFAIFFSLFALMPSKLFSKYLF